MKAVLYIGGEYAWARTVSAEPWALLPLGNRPLLEYSLEFFSELGIREILLLRATADEQVDLFAGDGARWGLHITPHALDRKTTLTDWLEAHREQVAGPVLYLGGPLLLRRTADYTSESLATLRQTPAPVCFRDNGECLFYTGPAEQLAETCRTPGSDSTATGMEWRQCGLDPFPIRSLKAYYELNMSLVRGESARYLTPGYFSKDGGYVGYNTVIRASVELHPPLMIGNHCRIEPVCEIGPDAVIGDHVIIDRQCEVSECLILPHTYIGHNLEVKRRIVSGSRLIDPEDESCIDFAEPWLIAGTELPLRFTDLIRGGVQWLLALGMALVLLIPFLVIMPLGRLRGSGRFKRCSFYGSGRRLVEVPVFRPTTRGGFTLRLIHGLSLDRWPQLLLVLRGRLWLCGQPLLRAPEQHAVYQILQCPFPAVFSFLDTQDADPDPQTAALYYTRVRSLVEDLRMLRDAFSRRLIQIFTPIA